ncbi:MAG TPA: undecaprenyldiphospho-muramoylpentapeptide beta-N-acetylglucosaminyltransferase [Longimicrobiales bacterium]
MSRVLFAGGGTGGHLYPAIALAEALQRDHANVDVHFVGALRGVEARVLPNEGKPHTLLPFQPLRRSRIWENWQLVPAMMRSANGLRRLFHEFKPELVVGTGGYASAPACMWALMHRIPVAVQEQNSHPGLTTRTLSRWASQIHLGFPEARRYIKPGKHTEVTSLGNPIRPPDHTIDRATARATFGLQPDSVVVLVVGGSQGSRAINEALLSAIAQASNRQGGHAPRLEVLWATGPTHIESINSRLPESVKPWVKTVGYITNMTHALAAASVAISRAGAMGTAELLAWGIPMVLIPLPTAAADHQTHNARAIAEAGAATMLVERELTPERLWQELDRLITDEALRNQMRAAALDRARPQAAEDIAQRLAQLLEPA